MAQLAICRIASSPGVPLGICAKKRFNRRSRASSTNITVIHWPVSGKGEALHALRGFLFLANEGKIRRRYYQEQLNQASCLNLVTNAVVLWNTVYMSAVLDQLKAEGYPVDDTDVAHLWPARYGHINPYGKYRFDVDGDSIAKVFAR
jgi:hypothetical protein